MQPKPGPCPRAHGTGLPPHASGHPSPAPRPSGPWGESWLGRDVGTACDRSVVLLLGLAPAFTSPVAFPSFRATMALSSFGRLFAGLGSSVAAKAACSTGGVLLPKKAPATSRGVRPCLFLTTCARACKSSFTRAASPRLAAKCRGVEPWSMANSSRAVLCLKRPARRAPPRTAPSARECARHRALTSQPWSRRNLTVVRWLFSFCASRHRREPSPPKKWREVTEALASIREHRMGCTSRQPTSALRPR
mmetsp:Transcript_1371/g.4473  ORF Transcript_1371/g.4473 Transcript_1371/m.4473 type:complete len:249 (-) Transcript_1371:356-1102(-)